MTRGLTRTGGSEVTMTLVPLPRLLQESRHDQTALGSNPRPTTASPQLCSPKSALSFSFLTCKIGESTAPPPPPQGRLIMSLMGIPSGLLGSGSPASQDRNPSHIIPAPCLPALQRPRVALTKYSKLVALQQDVQNQGVGRATCPLKALGQAPSHDSPFPGL